MIMLTDDNQFDFDEAVEEAIARLSKNPKGFILVAHSDCHTGKTRTSLQRLVDLDKAVATSAGRLKNNTLILFTADHSYDLRIKGESRRKPHGIRATERSSRSCRWKTNTRLKKCHSSAWGPGRSGSAVLCRTRTCSRS